MKIAPLMREYEKYPEIHPLLVHTGQHYSDEMSQLIFDQLEIPRPDINLEVGSASHAIQTAEIIKRFEPIVRELDPDMVLVVGDVNSTIACALVAVKLGVKVAHVEAGLRSFDRTMPEEINRVLTDAISDYLFVSETSGLENLKREGIPDHKVFFVGNVMIDTLVRNLKQAESSTILEELGLAEHEYALVTLHRPSNVDDPIVLGKYLEVFEIIGREIPVLFPAHPRTRKNIKTLGFQSLITELKNPSKPFQNGGLRITDPIGYIDFLRLMASAKVVLTDSGGIQEETTILKVPCLTLRENTERPITIEKGTNNLVGTDPERILNGYEEIKTKRYSNCSVPELWDGHAAERIIEVFFNEPPK